ncbi:XdhC family protein [Raoultibacter phocaeensis]|uniref:XdhC family protein n=1 Tax=Raoultibacter phocaeensis TaxID=2479841 RepID=UPI0015D62661|nr:XdhC/CoxI family protein [Raoultibacter phocaeensis]
MRELSATIQQWIEDGEPVALATVVKTWGSSPRAAGSLMAVDGQGRICGSVSGGCIEGSVVGTALDCLDDGFARLESFHAETRKAQEVGLSCGGSVEVLVSPLDPSLFALERALIERGARYIRSSVCSASDARMLGQTFVLAEAVCSEDAARAEGVVCFDAGGWLCIAPAHLCDALGEGFLREASAAFLESGQRNASTAHVGDATVFFSQQDPAPQLVCIGATHVAVHLCHMAHELGYRTIVVDPRGAFATEERFAMVDELVRAWPHEALPRIPLTSATAVCALTHDPKIDVPALGCALESPAFYIGSLGRYTTQLSRYEALVDSGYVDEQIARIFGPIGLDIGGKEPAEIALSVLAEMTAAKNGGAALSATMLESARRALDEEARCTAGAGKRSA